MTAFGAVLGLSSQALFFRLDGGEGRPALLDFLAAAVWATMVNQADSSVELPEMDEGTKTGRLRIC